jgi:hypothetical protein
VIHVQKRNVERFRGKLPESRRRRYLDNNIVYRIGNNRNLNLKGESLRKLHVICIF